jgi:nucleoside-diphosphate-sugar epimerase
MPVQTLTLLDTQFPRDSADLDWVRYVGGSIAETRSIASGWGEGVDIVFHLASIPGGAAESLYTLSRDVNIYGTIGLLEAAKAQSDGGGPNPVVVFASSIAVFGSPLPEVVDEQTALNPQMTYAAQKVVGETLVTDFSRREWLGGRSLRVAGVLARPPCAVRPQPQTGSTFRPISAVGDAVHGKAWFLSRWATLNSRAPCDGEVDMRAINVRQVARTRMVNLRCRNLTDEFVCSSSF